MTQTYKDDEHQLTQLLHPLCDFLYSLKIDLAIPQTGVRFCSYPWSFFFLYQIPVNSCSPCNNWTQDYHNVVALDQLKPHDVFTQLLLEDYNWYFVSTKFGTLRFEEAIILIFHVFYL